LGSIISNPKEPQYTIQKSHFELPKVHTPEKRGFDRKTSPQKSFAAGFLVKIFELANIDVGGHYKASQIDQLKTKTFETKYIVATDDYISTRIQDTEVQKWLVKNRKKVYMVTGVKIVRDPEAMNTQAGGYGAKAKVSAATGQPVSGGANLEFDSSKPEETSFKGGTDIIFAYELRAIVCKIVKKTTAEFHGAKMVTKGATLSNDREQTDEEEVMIADIVGTLDEDRENGLHVIDEEAQEDCDFII
jgi:hypothetical protein